MCDFHVRVDGLPLGRTSQRIAECVGNAIGIYRDVDHNADGSNPHIYLRLRVGINVEKPIPRVTHISTSKGESVQLSLSYEKLLNFCYFYGVMVHLLKDCPSQYDVEGDTTNAPQRYGEWMCASNRQGLAGRSSVQRPVTFNPMRTDLGNNKTPDNRVLKGVNLFSTVSKRPEMSGSRSDVADWRSKGDGTSSLSMSDLQQCVTKEFGERVVHHQHSSTSLAE